MEITTESSRYISFQLGDESYAIEVSTVKEILGIQSITPLPQVPDYVKGVMNLRGKIVPVIDLRTKFKLEEIEWDRNTSIIVISRNDVEMGIVVDMMNEVMDISTEDFRYNSNTNSNSKTDSEDFLQAMVEFNDQIHMILDLDQVLQKPIQIGID